MANWEVNGNATAAGNFLGTTNARPLSLRTNGGERVRIQTNGNVGIGLASPATKLHVNGDRVRLESGGKKLDLRADGGAVDIQSDTHNLFLHSSGPGGRNNVIINPFGREGNVGIGTERPSDKLHVVGNVRANDFLVTSDARLKTDIRPLCGALDRLVKLRGVEFSWRRAGEDGHQGDAPRKGVGVVAQEVELVAPELVVSGSGEDTYRGVNLTGVVAMLIESVKQLAANNVTLRHRVGVLEGVGNERSTTSATE
jgi:hypothetical protein